jgi:hypothetical protein
MKVQSPPTRPPRPVEVSMAASERDHVLDRLQRLRTIVPVFAQELASAKRQVAQPRRENRRLVEEVERLQRRHRAAGRAVREDGRAAARSR